MSDFPFTPTSFLNGEKFDMRKEKVLTKDFIDVYKKKLICFRQAMFHSPRGFLSLEE